MKQQQLTADAFASVMSALMRKKKVRDIFGFIHQENLMSLFPDTGTSLLMHAHPYIVPFAVE